MRVKPRHRTCCCLAPFVGQSVSMQDTYIVVRGQMYSIIRSYSVFCSFFLLPCQHASSWFKDLTASPLNEAFSYQCMRPYAASACKLVSPRHMSPAYAGALAKSVAPEVFGSFWNNVVEQFKYHSPCFTPTCAVPMTQMTASVHYNKQKVPCTGTMSCQ